MKIALFENWSSDRTPIDVTAYGVDTTTDILDFFLVTKKCRS